MRAFQGLVSSFDLSHNMSKCEIAVIRNLKGVKIALYGMTDIGLAKTFVKTTRIGFFFSLAIQNELNFTTTILQQQLHNNKDCRHLKQN